MKNIYEVQSAPWDRIHYYTADEFELERGDFAIVKNELGIDLVKIVGKFTISEEELEGMKEVKFILRKALEEDLEKEKEVSINSKNDFKVCKEFIKKHDLSMKLVDVHYSIDGGKLTFAFVSDERVDFRGLVKDLTNYFHKSIRLQQLGARDAARHIGDIGSCGQEQCCRKYLKKLSNVSIEMAEVQQIAHRGADRISGACGRLKCCLAYELDVYKENFKGMPSLGSIVSIKTEKNKGVVCGYNILKRNVKIRLQNSGMFMEVPIDDIRNDTNK